MLRQVSYPVFFEEFPECHDLRIDESPETLNIVATSENLTLQFREASLSLEGHPLRIVGGTS